ncbi:sigma-70 family RNA polymerase sigma factor [uncultured Dokdonia sp.]|uniref:RNA polymerase sigma factor n=1 Tax=uncultured Dokdonia sp. TaxID=575653 RepID=UPI00263896FF|nr:sigma-70 family RNA polymerase sigma factor [uncultured Dokdonia sp.]
MQTQIIESQLIDDLKKQPNHAAFTILVEKYQERLYWHIRQMVKNHEDTDDVLQNVFIKVHRSIHSFKGDSKLYTWLYRIATNEAITFLNKRAKQYHISSEALQDRLINSLESDLYFEGDEIQIQLQKAIQTLPEKQQTVFRMKYFQDITYEELSEITDTSVGALKSSYHIATKKITDYLKST